MRQKILLHIDPADLPTLFQTVQTGQASMTRCYTTEVTEVYFDTPELLLNSELADLSIQTSQQIWVQSLNCRVPDSTGHCTGGLIQWDNWSSFLQPGQLDLMQFSASGGQNPVPKKICETLQRLPIPQEIFRCRYTQQVWMLPLRGGGMASCVLQQGQTTCSGQVAAFSELGFELHNGEMTALIDFIIALMQQVPLSVGRLCRVEQGYALYRPQPWSATFAAKLTLPPQTSLTQVIQRIVCHCLVQIQSNQAALLIAAEPESLHQMRVGFRRLRAAYRTGKKIQPFPEGIAQELKWLDRKLGVARDWDVFAGVTLPRLTRLLATENGTPVQPDRLLALSSARAQAAHLKVSTALQTTRYARLLLNLLRWQVQLSEPANQKKINLELLAYSNRILKNNQQRLRRCSQNLRTLSPGALHALRITVKKIRYATDFFKTLYPSKRLQRYTEAIAALQELLGSANDNIVSRRLMRELQRDHPELQPDIQSSAALLVKQYEQNRASASQLLKKILHQKQVVP